jgi:hypothetical protein
MEARGWTLAAVGVVVLIAVAVLLAGDRFRTWWLANVLRNRLEAKRRSKRNGRG